MSWWVEMVADSQEDLIDAVTEHKYIPQVAKGIIITFISALDVEKSPKEEYSIHLKTEGHVGDFGVKDSATRLNVETRLVHKALPKPKQT